MADAWFFSRFFWCAAPRDVSSPTSGVMARGREAAPTTPEQSRPSPSKPIAGLSAPQLIARLRANDRDALGTLYTELFDTLARLAVLRTRSADTAKEIVHDIFLAFWARRDTLPLDMDVRVYLATAVRNRTRNLWDHDAVVASVEQAIHGETLDLPAIGQPAVSPDVAAEADDFHAAYREALCVLTERERAAALLRWEEGLTFEQIGRVLGVSSVGARAIILRAQRKVQAGLAKYRG